MGGFHTQTGGTTGHLVPVPFGSTTTTTTLLPALTPESTQKTVVSQASARPEVSALVSPPTLPGPSFTDQLWAFPPPCSWEQPRPMSAGGRFRTVQHSVSPLTKQDMCLGIVGLSQTALLKVLFVNHAWSARTRRPTDRKKTHAGADGTQNPRKGVGVEPLSSESCTPMHANQAVVRC